MADMHWRARIHAVGGGPPLGAGVLVDGERVITCAHVVDGHAEVRVALPGDGGEEPARVVWTGGWRALGDPGDIAVLALDRPVRAAPCALAPLGALRPDRGRPAHVLRALGFPEGHERDGTYVTVTTSADRQLYGEWLELDVEKAHLRRLDEGFSGAGVYDPVSGEVVGIVTDAELGDERGGTQGRMLPLDTVRRHWEGLDDLLPLGWMEPAPRRELRAVLDGGELTPAAVALAVRQAFPTFLRELPAFRSAWHAVRYVAEELTGEGRVERLLRELRDHAPGGVADRLTAWTRRWQPDDAGRGPAAAAVRTGSLMVRVEPMTKAKSLDLSVCALVDGVPVGRAGPVRVRPQQLRTKVEALLAAQVGAVADFDWIAEFVVPQGLMDEPFEEWLLHEPGAARPRALRAVPVVVRHTDRLKPLMVCRFTRERWETVRARGETRPKPVACSLTWDYQEFYDWLDGQEQLCALAYAATPGEAWLSAALDIGMPIMLWRRRDCGGGGHADCASAAFLDRLTRAVSGLDPDRLPYEVMRLRKEARSPERGGDGHCGHRLALFWDDPERRPDPPLAMGNKERG